MKKRPLVVFNINISNRVLYSFIVVVILLNVIAIGFAYGDFSTGNPTVLGHSGDELDVNIGGTVKTLQSAIDAGDLGGGEIVGTWCGLCGDASIDVRSCKGFNVCTECPVGWTRMGISNYLYSSTSVTDYICIKD